MDVRLLVSLEKLKLLVPEGKFSQLAILCIPFTFLILDTLMKMLLNHGAGEQQVRELVS